jgi:hypothetical protein
MKRQSRRPRAPAETKDHQAEADAKRPVEDGGDLGEAAQVTVSTGFSWGAGESEKDQYSLIEAQHVGIVEVSDFLADTLLRYGCNLVNHQSRGKAQTIGFRRLDEQAEQGASVGSLVNAQSVIEAVASKLSS